MLAVNRRVFAVVSLCLGLCTCALAQGVPEAPAIAAPLTRPTLVAQALAPLAGGFMLAHFGPMSLLVVLAACALCSMVMALVLGYVKPPAVIRILS